MATNERTSSPFLAYSNPFADIFKLPSMNAVQGFDFSQFAAGMDMLKGVGPNLSAAMDIQRRNLDALNAANQTLVQGFQTLVERQAELTRRSVEQAQALFTQATTNGPADEKLAQQIDLMKSGFERQVSSIREIQDIAVKVATEAGDIVTRRIAESLDEVKSAARSNSAPRAKLVG
jgi:phasin family protein